MFILILFFFLTWSTVGNIWFYSQGAAVPHLSYDLLQMVTNEHQVLQMPLVTLVEHAKNVKAFGKGIADFAGLKVDAHLLRYMMKFKNIYTLSHKCLILGILKLCGGSRFWHSNT